LAKTKTVKVKDTLNSCSLCKLDGNIIGAAVLINQYNFVQHAGIFVRYNGENKLIHFTGTELKVDTFKPTEKYFFKKFDFINPELAPSLLSHFELVQKESKPKFGYFYTGSYYGEDGKLVTTDGTPEYMTCVGFCLNFIKYFIRKTDFLNFPDWDFKTTASVKGHVNDFLKDVKKSYPSISINDFKAGSRRIYPIEYIAGTYEETLPVRKAFTEKTFPLVQTELERIAV
jgi:hypothetical protein